MQASNNKVKDKKKRAVPKNKMAGSTKDKLNVSQNTNRGKQRKMDVTET